MSGLDAAVERAYEVFAGYGLPPVMGYCAMCDSAAYERRLHGPPRSLPPEVVRQYVWDAMHHTGDERDFKHFVPRVLAEVAAGRADEVGLWLGRFRMAKWETWSVPEREAVRDVVLAVWERELASEEGPYGAEDMLDALGGMYDDVTPFLHAWAAREEEPARRHLADLVERGPHDTWWADDARAQVVEWLRARA